MNAHLQICNIQPVSQLQISGSKSESNRLLLLQALLPNVKIDNISDSEDTVLLQKALQSKDAVIDIHHAGTAMRFLTAYFSIQQDREVVLTGSQRMKQRPIGVLVEALKKLGADITYLEDEGFPPLKIIGKSLNKQEVSLEASVSSQFITALMLIAPAFSEDFKIVLQGKITSLPYLKMTVQLLNEIGVETTIEDSVISIKSVVSKNIPGKIFLVESDWSSASYFYSMVALSPVGTQIFLSIFKENSLQGDAALATIYKNFGVETSFTHNGIQLTKIKAKSNNKQLILNLNNTPDIAQTIAVTCFALEIPCYLTGLHTLKIKETDRLTALKNELEKFGASIHIDANSLSLVIENKSQTNKEAPVIIKTYNDHRMAMAFAPLALQYNLIIENAEVVNKSYPAFWQDLQNIGFSISFT